MKIIKATIAIIMAAVLVFGLTACSDSPTNVADKFLGAVKTNNAEEIEQTYAGEGFDLLKTSDDSNSSNNAIKKAMKEEILPKIQEFDYSLSNEKIDGDKATIDVKITTYDLGTAFANFMQNYIKKAFSMKLKKSSDEEIEKEASSMLSEEVTKLTEKTYEKTVTLNLIQKDDKWMVDEMKNNTDVVNAMTGGMYEKVQKLGDSSK